ncbi:MAG TPA: DUF2252 domain-containing protein [Rhizomicrobium sp.]|nr:DUF2252 domain-containing protein [Rhizomicrobium sp.]
MDQVLQAGKLLRDKVPRGEHSHWRRGEDTDLLKILRSSDQGRIQGLVPIRYGRMLASPFAFYRGSAAVMAADLADTPSTGLRVQACGDCHLLNFGGFATPERNLLFDINDFDETLPAPWEWDVKRLAVSFVLAARAANLSEQKGREAAIGCARSYRERIRKFAHMHPLDVWYARVAEQDILHLLPPQVRKRIKKRVLKEKKMNGSAGEFPKLADMVGGRVGIRDAPPLIFHPEISHTPDFGPMAERILAHYRQTLYEDRRALLDDYHFVDAAMKVVGVGSVGRRCWIVLMMSSSNDPMFLQFKEAVGSVLEPFAGKSAYPHHGQRVVAGQRLMQPASDMFLGWVTGENGVQFYVRQLRDGKIKPMVETFDAQTMCLYAEACGWVLARAHAKGGDEASIAGYLGSNDQFEKAIGSFAVSYADQVEHDHGVLKAAVRRGEVTALLE